MFVLIRKRSAVIATVVLLLLLTLLSVCFFSNHSDCFLYTDIENNIDVTPIDDIKLPSNVLPIDDILHKGKTIEFSFAYDNPHWIRPAYKYYWDKSYGTRWSDVPTIVNYSAHTIFTSYHTASIYYDFTHQLGIWDESLHFNLSNNIDNIVLVVINANVTKILTLDNQVLVITKPERYGLQVIEIEGGNLTPTNSDEPLLFQQLTPDGYEIDYCLIHKPDW